MKRSVEQVKGSGHRFFNEPLITLRREKADEPLRPSRPLETALSKKGVTPSLGSRTFLGEEVDYVEREEPIDRSSPACQQKRSILFVKPDYSVTQDLFSGEGVVNIDALHSFAPPARIEGNLAEGFHITTPEGRLWLVAFGTHMKEVEARLQSTKRQVVVRSAGPLPISLITLLCPDRVSSQSRYDFKSLYFPSIEGGSAFEVLTPTHTDTFLFAPPRKRLTLSYVRFEGEQLFVRRDYAGEIARLFALSGRFCYWEGKRLFESAQPIPFLEISYRGEILHVRGAFSGPISFYADGVEEVRVNGEKIDFTRERDRLVLRF
jgi:hypothetical protein